MLLENIEYKRISLLENELKLIFIKLESNSKSLSWKNYMKTLVH